MVGFAAETDNLIDNAMKKLKLKNLDYIIANDVTTKDSGFCSDFNTISILSADGDIKAFNKQDKNYLATKIFDIILKKPENNKS